MALIIWSDDVAQRSLAIGVVQYCIALYLTVQNLFYQELEGGVKGTKGKLIISYKITNIM